MSFLRTPGDDEAAGRVREMYDADRKADGYVWNLTRVFALRPGVLDAWRGLVGSIRGNMDLRRYELVTLAAACALKGSYCALAHGKILREKFFEAGPMLALARGEAGAGLSAADEAVMAFAAKVALDASAVTAADVDALRAHGLTEAEILDVALATAARSFFCKTLDAVGLQPDGAYERLDAPLREALTVGRPIAQEVSR